jgi:hypothetical protein
MVWERAQSGDDHGRGAPGDFNGGDGWVFSCFHAVAHAKMALQIADHLVRLKRIVV